MLKKRRPATDAREICSDRRWRDLLWPAYLSTRGKCVSPPILTSLRYMMTVAMRCKLLQVSGSLLPAAAFAFSPSGFSTPCPSAHSHFPRVVHLAQSLSALHTPCTANTRKHAYRRAHKHTHTNQKQTPVRQAWAGGPQVGCQSREMHRYVTHIARPLRIPPPVHTYIRS